MKPSISQRYLLADDFDERSKDLSMRRSAWTVISAISKLHLDGSFREFCADISLSENETNKVISELLANRLIHENFVTDDEPALVVRPIHELLKGSYSTLAVGMFGEDNDASQLKTVPNSSTAVQMRLGEFLRTEKSPSTIQCWIWDSSDRASVAPGETIRAPQTQLNGPKASPADASTRKETQRVTSSVKGTITKKSEVKKYKLQPIISQIEKLSSGGVEGSVLVYQVFLKVPTELLRNEGIESLKLVDANTEFSSQKLCQAIVRATTQITGYNLKIVGYNR